MAYRHVLYTAINSQGKGNGSAEPQNSVKENLLTIRINMAETRSDKTQGSLKEKLRCCWSPSQLGAFCIFRLKAAEEQCRSRAGWGWAQEAAQHQVGGAMACAHVRPPGAHTDTPGRSISEQLCCASTGLCTPASPRCLGYGAPTSTPMRLRPTRRAAALC